MHGCIQQKGFLCSTLVRFRHCSTPLLPNNLLMQIISLRLQEAAHEQLEAASAARTALQMAYEATQQQLASAQADVASLQEAAALAVAAQQASAARVEELQQDLATAQQMAARVRFACVPPDKMPCATRCLRTLRICYQQVGLCFNAWSPSAFDARDKAGSSLFCTLCTCGKEHLCHRWSAVRPWSRTAAAQLCCR